MKKEEWDALSPDEQEKVKNENPENVPDDATSEQGDEQKKSPPIENIVGEAVRKATKELKEELKQTKEEYEARLKELQKPQDQTGDYFEKEAARLESLGIIKTPEELKWEAEQTARTVLEMRRMEKERKKEIKAQIKKVDPEDRKLFEDDIIEELENFPENMPLPPDAAERALIYAKGKNADKLVAEAKKNIEKQLKQKEIEGEATGETGFIPEGGSTVTISNKTPTEKQKRLAAERGISVEHQIWLDERDAERKKKKQ